jgi:hypothetical protein
MAQTKTKAKAKPKSRSKKTSASKSTSKPKAPKAKSSGSTNGSASKSSNVEAVRKAAGKAKVPLVAGGAAIAGAAGGLALSASKKGRKSGLAKAISRRPKISRPKIKVDSKDVAKAARGVGSVSAQVSEIAGGLESAASGRNGKHRSPIEVVLQGLTARR